MPIHCKGTYNSNALTHPLVCWYWILYYVIFGLKDHKKKRLLKTLWKKKRMCKLCSIFSSSRMSCSFLRQKFIICARLNLRMLPVWNFLKFCQLLRVKTILTLYHTMLTFDDPEEDCYWKHCGKRKKMLVTSIFFFPPNVFYPLKQKL